MEVLRPVFKLLRRPASKPRVDLQTVRETLVYIESDCRECRGLEGVTAALVQTITEIDRVRNAMDKPKAPEVTSVRFIPAGLS